MSFHNLPPSMLVKDILVNSPYTIRMNATRTYMGPSTRMSQSVAASTHVPTRSHLHASRGMQSTMDVLRTVQVQNHSHSGPWQAP